MKKYLYILLAFIGCLGMTSCLESGYEDLDTYDGCEITGVVGTYYRYIDSATMANGQNKVIQKTLTTENVQRDENAGTLTFDVSLPSNLTDAEKAAVSASALVVIVNISTAAVVEPVNGAPAFGTPGDWSKSNQYKVTAANGDTKVWTVSLNLKK